MNFPRHYIASQGFVIYFTKCKDTSLVEGSWWYFAEELLRKKERWGQIGQLQLPLAVLLLSICQTLCKALLHHSEDFEGFGICLLQLKEKKNISLDIYKCISGFLPYSTLFCGKLFQRVYYKEILEKPSLILKLFVESWCCWEHIQ